MKDIAKPVTLVVSNDEPCFNLSEVHLQSPDCRGFRRYRILSVIRDDRVSEAWFDLGDARRFAAVPEFRIPGGLSEPNGSITVLHTVGELVDVATEFHVGKVRPPDIEPTDLITGYYEQLDQKARWRRKESQFGALSKTQRD